MSVTDLVAVNLKDICHWEVRIINPMLDLQRGTELSKLIVEECSAGVSHVASPDISLHITEITHGMISEGGWHCVHEPSDWHGQYLERKKERNLFPGNSK